MDLKDECACKYNNIQTVIEEPTGNVYEAITIMAKRANQINLKKKN
jgi:DNA-directed RNA polymerase subunit K/omega